ncbi:hypothetical protein I4U23_020257 [Adineta vaga]|nr:hypothetical protein I4U23_020257 [Adineta vaga]
MTSSTMTMNQCASCHKASSVSTCDGCKQSFCSKHVAEHRQQLNNQLETLMHEHDSFRQDVGGRSPNRSLLKQIDKWEKESIAKIQAAAKKTREDLQQTLNTSNEQLTTLSQDMTNRLRNARKDDKFSEIDLTRWTRKLNDLKAQMKYEATIQIPEDSISAIHFIRIKQDDTEKNPMTSTNMLTSRIQERFAEVNGLGTIEDRGACIKHADTDTKFVHVRGEQLYSQGRHVVRFRIEKGSGSYNIFIGICPSSVGLRQILYHLEVVAGWFSNSEVWLHGKSNSNDSEGKEYQTDDLKVDDIFELTIDCDKKQLELFHDRTNKKQIINIDTTKAPLPWHILLALRHQGDSVRILPNN